MGFTLDNTLIAALIAAVIAIFLRMWQANHEMNVLQQQRFDDAIGNEQRIIDNMAVRARLLIQKLADDPQYQPSDSDIETELSGDTLTNSNITHLSYELSSINIQGRIYSQKVVHHCRGYFTKLCIEARENKRSGRPIDTENFRNEIISETMWAAGEASELSRAVRERKNLWFWLWFNPSPYHSILKVHSPQNNKTEKPSQIPDDAQPADIQTS